jgi:hypothetical protein
MGLLGEISILVGQNMLKKNIDRRGKMIRFITAILLLLLAIWLRSWIFFFVSLFVFFEALMNWCVVYQLLGKSSCPVEPSDKDH